MARPLSAFSAEVKSRGIAKSSHFYIEFGIPTFMGGAMAEGEVNVTAQDEIKLVTLFAESVQFPEFALATSQIRDDGNGREFVYDKLYPPIVCSFMCDSDMLVKRFFDKWTQGPVKTVSGTYRYQDDYLVPEMKIYQLNEKKEETYVVTLHDVFPKLVNDLSSNSSSKDYHRVQVQFSYRHWTSQNLTTFIKPNVSIMNRPDAIRAKKLGEIFGYDSIDDAVKGVFDKIVMNI